MKPVNRNEIVERTIIVRAGEECHFQDLKVGYNLVHRLKVVIKAKLVVYTQW